MTEQQTQVAKFNPKTWATVTVKNQVVPLLPDGEQGWAAFNVALMAAYLKDEKGQLRDAIANNPTAAMLAVVKCARLGLSLHPADQHFSLIARKGKVEGEIEYRGWLSLCQDSGQIASLGMDVVYKQEFDRTRPLEDPSTGEVLHAPHHFTRDSYPDTDIIGAYAWAQVKGRAKLVTVFLGRDRIEKLRAMGYGDTPAWKTHYRAMCLAKALKVLGKDPRMPRGQKWRDIQELTEEVKPVTATVRPEATAPAAPAPQLTVTAGPASDDPDWDAASQASFEAHDKDPLPSPEDELKIQQASVRKLATENSVSTPKLLALIKRVTGADLSVDQLAINQCADVIEALRAS